jgi:predicted RNA-binding protein with RPS1 domain
MDDYREGTEHWATVQRLSDYGAFCRLDGLTRDGLIHISEISMQRIDSPASVLHTGMRVKVQVVMVNEADGKMGLSMKRVKPTLPDDFSPATVVVFQLPVHLEERENMEFFTQYGQVLDISYGSRTRDDGVTREFTFVTFESRDEAVECLEHCKQVPVKIGSETHMYRVHVKMSQRQDYKKEKQQELDEWWERQQEEMNMDPMERRMKRRAERDLREMIPFYFDN